MLYIDKHIIVNTNVHITEASTATFWKRPTWIIIITIILVVLVVVVVEVVLVVEVVVVEVVVLLLLLLLYIDKHIKIIAIAKHRNL